MIISLKIIVISNNLLHTLVVYAAASNQLHFTDNKG